MPSRVMQQKKNVKTAAKPILRRRKEIVVKFCRNWFSRRKATLKIRRKNRRKSPTILSDTVRLDYYKKDRDINTGN